MDTLDRAVRRKASGTTALRREMFPESMSEDVSEDPAQGLAVLWLPVRQFYSR